MALILPTGEYISIEAVTERSITVRFHSNKNHRDRFKSGSESKYEHTIQQEIFSYVDMSSEANPEISIKNNSIVAGYATLKNLPEFAWSTDA